MTVCDELVAVRYESADCMHAVVAIVVIALVKLSTQPRSIYDHFMANEQYLFCCCCCCCCRRRSLVSTTLLFIPTRISRNKDAEAIRRAVSVPCAISGAAIVSRCPQTTTMYAWLLLLSPDKKTINNGYTCSSGLCRKFRFVYG